MRPRLLALICAAPLCLQAQTPPAPPEGKSGSARKAERDAVVAALNAMEKEMAEAEYHDGVRKQLARADARAAQLALAQYWSGGQYYAASSTSSSGTFASALGFTGHEQTDPSGLIYMQARFYMPQYGRFTTWDRTMPYKVENPQSFNFYAYAQNNPLMYIDPTGNDITITAHRVGGIGPYHTAVRFTPNNQEMWKNNPMFSNVDSNGRRYVTLSAGPSLGLGGNLTKEINKQTDITPQAYQSGPLPMPGGQNENQVFDKMLGNFNNYANNLEYNLFPTGQVPMFDPNYNSNSFTDGLLQSTGFPQFDLPIWAPGWDSPVPRDAFAPPPLPELKPEPAPTQEPKQPENK